MKQLFILIALLLAGSLCAQRLEVGGFLGAASLSGDLIDGDIGPFSPAYGIIGRYQFSPAFAARTNFIFGNLEGEVGNESFESSITELSLVVEWHPFNQRKLTLYDETAQAFVFNKRTTEAVYDQYGNPLTPQQGYFVGLDSAGNRMVYDKFGNLSVFDPTGKLIEDRFRTRWSPYVFAGFGGVLVDPEVKIVDNDGNTETVPTDPGSYLAFPLGVGLKVDFHRNWTAGVDFGVRPTNSDELDGSVQGENNDWYAMGGAFITYSLGVTSPSDVLPADADGDGLGDVFDQCPEVAGLPELKGCPDSDNDGIADPDDACADKAGPLENEGCPYPDQDDDGVADKDDLCPTVAGLIELGGCPDRDGDSIPDGDDPCPDAPGPEGCPDTDGDGLYDNEDECPDEAGIPSLNGCPDRTDTDGDGIIDSRDRCPNFRGTEATQGCPDRDEDGVADNEDECPTLAGPPATSGCPELSEESTVLDLRGQKILFETNSTVLDESSFILLDQVRTIMEKNPDRSLRIMGHTDNSGSARYNKQLSEQRAKACYEYLIERGIDPDRITYEGFGEEKPIAENDTPQGREINRRVEFELSK